MTESADPSDGPKRSHKWWQILLGILTALVAVVVLGTALFMRFSGLRAPAEVVRDSMGILHIYADNPHDLFMVQGYVHAQEWFRQMDFRRHVGAGRRSEMFGETQVETDFFLGTMG